MKPAFIAYFLLASATATVPQAVNAQVNRSCIVAIDSEQGSWVGSRGLSGRDGKVQATRDSYDWTPKENIAIGPGMTLKWELGYYWPATTGDQKSIPDSAVMVSLNFTFQAQAGKGELRNPQRSWLHLYRSTDPAARISVSSTSLSSFMLWHQYGTAKLSTKAVVPLDELLAFGTGFDMLVWHIRSAPNEYGGTTSLAKGVLPISAMRGKTSEIPKLRKLLDKKAANFRKECAVPIVVGP